MEKDNISEKVRKLIEAEKETPVNENGLTKADLMWLRGFEPRDIKGCVAY